MTATVPTGRRTGARLLLAVSFLAASIAYSAWWVSGIVFDPASSGRAAHALLATPAVQRSLSDDISRQLDRELPETAAPAAVHTAVAQALRDPRVTTAFADALTQLHRAMLSPDGNHAAIELDPRMVTSAIHDALAQQDPGLAAKITAREPITVRLGGGDLPHIGPARGTFTMIQLVALIIALMCGALSLALEHGGRAVRRTGRRIAYLSIVPLALFEVAPPVLTHYDGETPQATAAVLRSLAGQVVPSAVILLVAGIAIAIGVTVAGWLRGPTGTVAAEPPARSAAPGSPVPTPLSPAARGGEPQITEKLYL